jgi:hypothetical protein
MCRSIKQLRGETDPTDEEIDAAALQFVRKISGFRTPSRVNQPAFDRAVAAIADSSRVLLDSLEVRPPTRPAEL